MTTTISIGRPKNTKGMVTAMKEIKFRKTVAMIAALTMSFSSLFAANACVFADEFDPALIEYSVTEYAASSYSSLKDNQKEAYDKIIAACDEFMESDVTLSTNYFKKLTLSQSCTYDEIAEVYSMIYDSGAYFFLNEKFSVFGTTSGSYNTIVLMTVEKYRDPANREADKPKITVTTQPEDASAAVGGKATFTVAATGSNLTYQWQYSFNGTKWYNQTSGTGVTTNSFTTAAVQKSWNGVQYRCKITDGTNTVYSNVATLTVS